MEAANSEIRGVEDDADQQPEQHAMTASPACLQGASRGLRDAWSWGGWITGGAKSCARSGNTGWRN